jgi:F1F0 ATPase subunit 2
MQAEPLLVCFFAGAVLGAFYFGGLWWTVQRAGAAQRPLLLLVASWLVRATVLLLGMYFVMGGDWRRLIACVAGVLAARGVLVYFLRPARPSTQEIGPYGTQSR